MVVVRDCGVSVDGNWCGGISSTVAGKPARASGHIVLPVVARWAAGPVEDRKTAARTQQASLLPAHFFGRGSDLGSFDPDPQHTVHRGRCDWRLSTLKGQAST